MLEVISTYPLLGYLFIFCARVMDMSLDVFRLLLLARGYSLPAAALGFVEVCIFITALGTVMSGGALDLPKVVVYAGGFATGNLVGSYIEGKMAFGYVVVQIFPECNCAGEILVRLREDNFGVTRIEAEGRSGPREILVVTTKRKSQSRILRIIESVAPGTFFSVSDVRTKRGGVFPQH